MTVNSSPAVLMPAVLMEASPLWAAEEPGPSGPAQDAGATLGVVTRLDQGPGWTLDVVRPRKVDNVRGGDAATGAASELVA
jgi:hypothetical protein